MPFFTYFTVASISIRFFAGKVSDVYGRSIVLKFSTITMAFAMTLIGFATTPAMFFVGAVFLGMATGMNTPTIFAWTIDLAHHAHLGRAMATMYIALELGIGVGAVVSGSVYGNNAEMFPLVFACSALFAIAAFFYLLLGKYQRPVQAGAN